MQLDGLDLVTRIIKPKGRVVSENFTRAENMQTCEIKKIFPWTHSNPRCTISWIPHPQADPSILSSLFWSFSFSLPQGHLQESNWKRPVHLLSTKCCIQLWWSWCLHLPTWLLSISWWFCRRCLLDYSLCSSRLGRFRHFWQWSSSLLDGTFRFWWPTGNRVQNWMHSKQPALPTKRRCFAELDCSIPLRPDSRTRCQLQLRVPSLCSQRHLLHRWWRSCLRSSHCQHCWSLPSWNCHGWNCRFHLFHRSNRLARTKNLWRRCKWLWNCFGKQKWRRHHPEHDDWPGDLLFRTHGLERLRFQGELVILIFLKGNGVEQLSGLCVARQQVSHTSFFVTNAC